MERGRGKSLPLQEYELTLLSFSHPDSLGPTMMPSQPRLPGPALLERPAALLVVLPTPWGQVRRQFRHPNLHHHPPSCSLAEMSSPTQSHGQNIPEVGVTVCRALAPSVFLGSFVLTLRPLSPYMSLAILCSRTRSQDSCLFVGHWGHLTWPR